MSTSEDSVLKLVGMVYDAALDQRKWPTFLEAFAHAVGGCSAMLRSTDLQTSQAGFVASVGYEPAWQSAYCNHFVRLDYYNTIMSQDTSGTIFSSDQHFDLTELHKSEYYNDYLLPQDKVHALGTTLDKNDSYSLVLGAQRGKRAGAFGGEQVRLMGILAPHVSRAVQVHRKISSVTVEKDWALGALGQLRMGVILTNRCGTPLFVNRAAEHMLTPSQGIGVYHGRLVLNTPLETARLYKLIVDAAQDVPGTTCGGDLRIAMPDGEFLHCMVTPIPLELSARFDISLASGCVAVFLSKPGGLQLPPKRLAALYGLTPAEARLAAKLAAFRSVEQAADDLCTTVSTARAQLKSVFAKTGAQNQAGLLMLLATGTLALCRDE
ncbi:MAG: hypothetical protein PHD65_11445 [Gallionella sp.]|nr:hypothetical protein [Gallionella sp.]